MSNANCWKEYEERQAEMLAELRVNPIGRTLINSGQLAIAIDMLRRKRRKERMKWDPPEKSLEYWVLGSVISCMSEPDPGEMMTAKERRDAATKIKHHCEGLASLLRPFMRSGNSRGLWWPFQPHLDRLALDLSVDYTETLSVSTEDRADIEHRARFAIYYALMDRLEDVFDTLIICGDHLASMDTVVKKPNDSNAKRLYFLRVMTRLLRREFGAPCRNVALALAGAFFDCSDLDEAAVSKLAPVAKGEGYALPIEVVEQMRDLVKECMQKSGGNSDPDKVEELEYYLNFYEELLRNNSA